MQMRVAFVTETYPPELNGVATTTAQFVEGLLRLGHHVQLLRPRQHDGDAATGSGSLHEVLVPGLPIPRYPHLRMGRPCRRSLQQLWSRQRPDVVHIATEGPLGWSALHAARRLDLPVTSDFRTNFDAYSRHYGFGWLQRPITAYLRHFHNRTNRTLVPTEALRRELEAAGYQRLHVVQRGVDTVRFDPSRRDAALRRQWGVGDDEVILGYVGRLAAEKNLDLLLDAFRAVRRTVPTARLVLVGDGPLRASLQAAHPDVIFAGLRNGPDLAAHYASLDLFVFPSLTETFGNVTVEAMASGLPVLAFDHAAAGQLIRSGHNGWLVPPGDALRFVAAAEALARDPQLRRAIASQARVAALAQGWDGVVARFASQLAAACDEGSPWRSAADSPSPCPAPIVQDIHRSSP